MRLNSIGANANTSTKRKIRPPCDSPAHQGRKGEPNIHSLGMVISQSISTELPSVYSVQPTATPSFSPTETPTALPTIQPAAFPTAVPSRSPTQSPTPQTCSPGDRAFCTHRGYCSTDGLHCVCDDPLHVWPSERCVAHHEGGELAPGQFCIPDAKDYYCSWMGCCDSSGSTCICEEYPHRTSADRCLTWRETPGSIASPSIFPTQHPSRAPYRFPTPPPAPAVEVCTPSDRAFCSHRSQYVSWRQHPQKPNLFAVRIITDRKHKYR
jgi:hypothetical protein